MPQKKTNAEKLSMLKTEADQLGIVYAPTIGMETLKAKITERKLAQEEFVAQQAEESPAALRARSIKEATALVRVRISTSNPDKQNRQGDWQQAGNNIIGTIRRYVPYNTIWHVEQILLNAMQESFYQQRHGRLNAKHRLVPEFVIEKLDAITPAEVAELKKIQNLRLANKDT
jgi:hypothetical protein